MLKKEELNRLIEKQNKLEMNIEEMDKKDKHL